MSLEFISIRGAREHNLAGFDLDIPRDKLVVITGLSGSGKSSLAFDTIYAEGQRRYVESLSSYSKQFLQDLPRPQVDVATVPVRDHHRHRAEQGNRVGRVLQRREPVRARMQIAYSDLPIASGSPPRRYEREFRPLQRAETVRLVLLKQLES